MNLQDKNRKMLVDLVLAGIRNQPLDMRHCGVENIAGVDWTQLLDEALKHQVVTIVYKPLAENSERLHVPGELLEKFRVYTLYKGMEQERNYAVVGSVLKKLTEAEIEVIVLKGLVIRELYPYPNLRSMCDFDLLVKPGDLREAGRIIEESGFGLDVDDGQEIIYSHKIYGSIELHRLLAPNEERYEKITGLEEQVWENAIPVVVSGANVLALCPLDCAVFLVIHMAKHIISSELELRDLCDFFLVVDRYRNEIDWNKFFRKAAEFHVNIFARALMKICRTFFGLELPDGCLKAVDEFRDDVLMENLIEDIFDTGASGKSSDERINANRMLYYSGKKNAETFGGKVSMYLKLLFPAAAKLDKRYRYAKKCLLLLPVAWMHRFIYCLVRKDIDFREKTAAFFSLKSATICAKRGEMLRGLGLLD
ncbi:MAG: nucleotidyltransferase family protein [Bacillota bacterium]